MAGEADTLFSDLQRLSPKVTGGLLRMRQEAYRDGTVEAKYKLLAAMTMQGCPGEEWALKAFAAYQERSAEDRPPSATTCCVH